MDSHLLRGTYGVALAHQMLGFARARGFDETDMLALMQTSRETLDDPDARLPFGPAMRFWEHVVRTLDDPSVPVQVAEGFSPERLGVVGFIALTAPTPRESLRLAARYYALLADTARLELSETEAGVRVAFERSGERTLGLRVMNEISVASLLRVSRRLLNFDFEPLEVAFRHPAPHPLHAHRRFFGTVRFGAEWDGLVIPHAAFERAPARPQPEMSAFFAHYAATRLGALARSDTLVDRVRAHISKSLVYGEPRLGSIARALGTSERTLRRELDAKGTSFRALVDEVRRSAAQDLLSKPESTVTDVAFMLGFSEVSAFSRAFRRWFGRPPRSLKRGR